MKPHRFDALILTALLDELEPVLAFSDGGTATWRKERDSKGFPYHVRELAPVAGGPPLLIAAASARPRGKVSSGGHEAPTPSLPHLSVEECVRYTLTVAPDVALLGMSFTNEQDAALTAAAAFQPLTPEQLADVRRRAVLAIEGKGKVWWDPVETPGQAATSSS